LYTERWTAISIAEMIDDIISSDLGPMEKMFLTVEWNLRKHKPYELSSKDLGGIREEIRLFVMKSLSLEVRTSALEKAKSVFDIRNDEKAFSLVVALAYFSYIGNEVVYELSTRREMLSKVSELGFLLPEVESLYEKWEEVFGDYVQLINKLFSEKRSFRS